ncbi:hypothetical protein SHIRM173S_06156 [Streptomyces hirsutus]
MPDAKAGPADASLPDPSTILPEPPVTWCFC